MSALIKPYEISLWEDVLDNNGEFQEQRICVIGADTMGSQSRALNPTLVTNVNGSNTLTFSIYYTYIDNLTGQKVDNPFAPYITNERKIKLYYDKKWYDFIIKSIKYDSVKKDYVITATDQYVNELAKNGFNKTFDAELSNNVGSVQTLAQRTLVDTDWDVPSINPSEATPTTEFIPDIAKESLVKLKINLTNGLPATQIVDSTVGKKPTEDSETIPNNAIIYAFYSCCADKTKRFQFYYFSDESIIEIDDEKAIVNREHQYYVDDVTYSDASTGYGIYIPEWAILDTLEPISTHYRGARYVYSPDTHFSPVLKNYVTTYTKDGEAYYGFAKTTYKAPNLIDNWVTNSSEFRSTAGWTTATIVRDGDPGTVVNEAIRWEGTTQHTLLSDLRDGKYSDQYDYEALLHYVGPTTGALVNSGFYDNRISIGNLTNGKQYVVRIKETHNSTQSGGTLRLGQYTYDSATKTYTITEDKTFFKIDLSQLVRDGLTSPYYYGIVTIANANFTPNQFKKQLNGKVVLILSGTGNMSLFSLEVFEYIPGNCGVYEQQTTWPGFTLPTQILDSEEEGYTAKIITTYYLYNKYISTNPPKTIDEDTTKTADDYIPAYKGDEDPLTLGYHQEISCEKRRSISLKESNYFNIIQTICENFECYAIFDIEHNEVGKVTQKRILFKNFLGKDNYAGFRYGVNLKSVSRTDDSKQIITKLIVKQNANEFGKDGFCTIARAGSNETGENFILNFDYYINHGLLDFSSWVHSIYDLDDAEGKDIDPEDENTNSNGYYVRLRTLNDEIEQRSEDLKSRAVVLAHAQADLSIYQNGLAAATDEFEKADEDLYAITGGYHYNQIKPEIAIPERDLKYLVACSETLQAKKDYERKVSKQEEYVNNLLGNYTTYEDRLDTLIQYKEALNKAFYSKYYRFIQEGTWNSEDYYDDEKYYLDALSTNYDASMPKTSYNISVLELSQLPGYEGFTFALGDKTFMEDPEFFGYDESGAPIRERVLLTEISYSLDQPDKNTIKVSNYATSFQDLFKKITATVQSVQYSAGTYDRAGQIAMANDTIKSEFIQGALSDAGTVLQNLAQQSVRIDDEGLTITDSLQPNKLLRAVSGGILLSQDGGLTWDVGITADGINAKTITTGILNTGAVNVMYSDEPTFRWDAFGLTAYAWEQNSPLKPIFSEGVRFDRMGIYGFNITSGDGAEWHPNSIVDWEINTSGQIVKKSDDATHTYVRSHSIFELTERGLYLDLGKGDKEYDFYYDINHEGNLFATPMVHAGTVQLGKIEDALYNAWTSTGTPYYNTSSSYQAITDFTKVMSIITQRRQSTPQETLALYDDGTMIIRQLYLIDGISYTDGSGLVNSAYITSDTRPNDPTKTWSSLPNTGSGWHKQQQVTDNWGISTMNNGTAWYDKRELLSRPGTSSIVHDIYYYTQSQTVSAPATEVTEDSFVKDAWTLHQSSPTASIGPYRFHAVQTQIIDDTTTTLSCTVPELEMAYDGSSANQQYATFLRLTNFTNSEGLHYDNRHLYINASYINTGTLSVSKNNNVVLYAAITGQSAGTVYLQSANYSGPTTGSHYSSAGTKMDVTNGTITSQNFAIESDGNAYFNGTVYANKITGTSGTTGGLQINFTNGTISSDNFSIDANGNATYSGGITATQISGSTDGSKPMTINFSDGTITSDHFGINSDGSAWFDGPIAATQISGTKSTTHLTIDFDNGTITSDQFSIDSNGNATFDGVLSADQLTSGNFLVKRGTTTLIDFSMRATNGNAYLQSADYDGPDSDEIYADAGMRIDLKDKYIKSKNFVIDASGNVYIKGTLEGGVVRSANYAKQSSSDVYSTDGTEINLENGYITTPYFYTSMSGSGFRGNLTATTTQFNQLLVTANEGGTGTISGLLYMNSDDNLTLRTTSSTQYVQTELSIGYSSFKLSITEDGATSVIHSISGDAFSGITIQDTSGISLTGSTTTISSLTSQSSRLYNISALRLTTARYGSNLPTSGMNTGDVYFKIVD